MYVCICMFSTYTYMCKICDPHWSFFIQIHFILVPFILVLCGFALTILTAGPWEKWEIGLWGMWGISMTLGWAARPKKRIALCSSCAAFKIEPSEWFWLNSFEKISLKTIMLHCRHSLFERYVAWEPSFIFLNHRKVAGLWLRGQRCLL